MPLPLGLLKKRPVQGKIIVNCDTKKKKEQNKEELKLGAEMRLATLGGMAKDNLSDICVKN